MPQARRPAGHARVLDPSVGATFACVVVKPPSGGLTRVIHRHDVLPPAARDFEHNPRDALDLGP
jgi:hypothetical protein